MSQVNITLNTNTVDINTTNNQVVVTDPTNPTTVNVVQPVTTVVEVITAGPQGPQGIPGPIPNTGSFVTTSSFNAFTSSYNTGSFTGSFTGSLFGTSSWANNAISSSYALSSSFASNSLSSSFATTASFSSTASVVESIANNVTNNVDNYILTATGGSTINGESSLTFDGDALRVGSKLEQGFRNTARGDYSHAEGNSTIASGSYSHAEGEVTIAQGRSSHAEGYETLASGDYSHTEGASTQATKEYSHAEGESTIAQGYASHAEGSSAIAQGDYSHAEGEGSLAKGDYSHAEGSGTIAEGEYSHAEGESETVASGRASHAEGRATIASGRSSHAEGEATLAAGQFSHAEGSATEARADYSHAEGLNTIASGDYQHVQGQYNRTSNAQSAFIVGNGVDDSNRSNLIFAAGNTVQVTGSLQVSGSITGSLFGTSSFAISSSNATSASFASTASFLNTLNQNVQISGSLKLDPTQDPDPLGLDLDSTVLFQSSSNTALGYDLYFRQNGNLVKWKWVEGNLESGLLYGGVVTYSGSNVFVSPGSGIISEHNATTGSEISPTINYVTWNAITQSIANIATKQVTYLYIDQNGDLQQQSSRFTSQQYHDYIPLGAVGHFDYTQVSAFGGGVQTAYDQISQTSNFIDAFGPLKVSGYGLTGQANSLRLSVGSGISFIHGGFYENDPEFPSQTTTPSQTTASLARVQRSGSSVLFDTNGGNLYTAVDPTQYDRDGDGVLHSVGSGNWSIQRVFSDPKTGVLYVYYGQARYTSLLNALQYLPTDPFTEGDTFDFTTFIGFLVLKGNASNITDTAANQIIPAGLFRGSGQGSGGGIALSNLDDLTDVSITSPTNGQALIYDSGIWQNGNPTSASFASTASFLNSTTNAFLQSGNSFGTQALIGTNDNQSLALETSGSVRMFISSSGNIGIGTTTPVTRLTVVGATQTGSTSVGILDLSQTWNTTGVVNAFNINITNTASNGASTLFKLQTSGTNALSVNTVGAMYFGSSGGAAAVGGAVPSTGLFATAGAGTSVLLAHFLTTQVGYGIWGGRVTGARTVTSGENGMFKTTESYQPTAGTGVYNTFNLAPTINQTGGANGITRGLYVNPTLTSAFDFRAIETTNGRNIFTDTTAASGSANSGSLLDLSQTWNTTGTPTAIKLNVIDTASNSNSILMELFQNSTSRYKFDKQGVFTTGVNGKIVMQRNTNISGNMFSVTQTGGAAGTSGIVNVFNLAVGVAPTSGNLEHNVINYNGVINQTGGANGITRGLFINPTLTAAADFRAIETTQGKVILTDTVSAGSGSLAGGLLDLRQTWNTTGTPTAISLAITDTASNANSKLINITVGGINRFFVSKNGAGEFAGLVSATGFNNASSTTALSIRGGASTSAIYSIALSPLGTQTHTTGTGGALNINNNNNYNPTSGTGIYNFANIEGGINQTGGANGITRGLYINPTLTAAADFRAIEVTGGKLVYSSTITAPGTTGDQTINKISGKVNAAMATTSLVVTNSLVTTSSIVMCQLGTNDASCVIKSVVEANGSFTINYTAPTAETVIKFTVIN